MASYNVLDARNNLSRLIAAAEDGEDVTIMRRGREVVRLVAIDSSAHTGRDFARWLRSNPLPERRASPQTALDETIAENRDAWA